MPDDLISLRPRMTIHVDLHPELYELFKRTPEKRHNALAMQMLVRMATIERYSGFGSSPTHREENRRGMPYPIGKADDQIGLRPRLTIFKDLHPELYDQFKKVSASSHNGLVVQMLSRMATLDRYEGVGVWLPENQASNGESEDIQDISRTKKATRTVVKQISKSDAEVVKESHVTTSIESVSIAALKNAVGDMFD